MNIQQLEYVIALDEYRHFVTAANHCNVTQPTLTMQLRKLEEELDIQLFDRSKKPLKPTPEGEIFIKKSRRILKDIKDLYGILDGEKNSVEGVFRLAVIPTLAPYLLPLFLPKFAAEYPDTQLNIEELESELIIKALNEGRLDMAIMATPTGEKDLDETLLFSEAFLFYGPLSHPLLLKATITASDLDAGQLLLLSEGHCFRNQALKLCGNQTDDSPFNFKYESGSIEALKGLVQRNIGYTLVPELSVGEPDIQYVKRFADPQPSREVSLVYHNSFNRPVLVESVKHAIRESLPAHISKPKEFVRIKWR